MVETYFCQVFKVVDFNLLTPMFIKSLIVDSNTVELLKIVVGTVLVIPDQTWYKMLLWHWAFTPGQQGVNLENELKF